ncbi:MAG: DUF3782 domain-containing protein [Vulcanisaeta sp.]|nr:DUF3782 domain-containing protein [Vulcanisaeta sp.]
MGSTDSTNLREEILKLLEEDREFRYAVAGLLGYREVLERLDRHEEELRRLREDFLAFVKENERRWEENEKRWVENERRWEEAFKRFETIEKILAEYAKILKEHTDSIMKIEATLGRLGGRWGRNMERMVLEIFREVLEKRGIEPGRVEKFEYIDYDGKFYKRKARIEVGVYVHDEKLYLIEVKSLAEYEDVERFHDKAQIVEKILGRKADKLILTAVNIYEDALERAGELGIDVIYGAVIPPEQ